MVVADGLIASRLASTLDRRRIQIPGGSEPARDGY